MSSYNSNASTAPVEVKVCIIGESDVGKTSLSMRYCQGEFSENSTPTIGASFLQHRVSKGGMDISLQIWDTAGQERFRSMAPMYYRGAKAAILVFDVTNEESFRRSMSWLRDLKAHADPDVVVCIAGNKFDKGPTFDLKAVEEYSNSVDASFFRTSAMTGENVDSLFDMLTTKIVEILKEKLNSGTQGDDNIDITARKSSREKDSSCC
mmetsp:Transcript_9907/g.16444  ORF Transcript_9907/g.16444 Transcript_9907/m.16444 type:complete len:208 (+) Transcript_9907:91-714(+)